MNRAKLIEHCYNCGENIDDIEDKTATDVSQESLMCEEPWDGTYYLRYKICPVCGKPNAITIWHSSYEGYEKIRDFKV